MLNSVMEEGYRLPCATCLLPEVFLLSYLYHHGWGWGVWPALPAPAAQAVTVCLAGSFTPPQGWLVYCLCAGAVPASSLQSPGC